MNYFSKITAKGWIAIAIVVVIIIGLYLWNKNSKNVKVDCTKTPTDPLCKKNTTTNTTTTTPVSHKGESFPIGYGSKDTTSDAVMVYQMYLNSLGASLKTDGVWGPLTEAASVKYTGFSTIPYDYFSKVVCDAVDAYGDTYSSCGA